MVSAAFPPSRSSIRVTDFCCAIVVPPGKCLLSSVRTAPIQVSRTRPRETRRKERAKDRGSRQLFFLMGQFMAPGPAPARGTGALDGYRRMKSQDCCTAAGVDGRPAAVPVLRPDQGVPCDRTE